MRFAIKDVSKARRDADSKGINLDVAEGEFVVILGFSGTGKTTLINLMAGLEQPTTGSVTYQGHADHRAGPERGCHFSKLFADAVADGAWQRRTGCGYDVSRVVQSRTRRKGRSLRGMVGLSHAATRRPAELSGGMRQRVNVARALAMDPEMLLLDEPLSALDALTRANLADEIEAIWDKDKKTCVLITNDVDEAIILADRIIALNPDGTLGDEFKVTIPRPRDRIAMNNDATFKTLRAQVTNYLMDVGIASKVEETRTLPDVTPIHGVPAAVAKAQDGGLDGEVPEFLATRQSIPHAQRPADGGGEFRSERSTRASLFRLSGIRVAASRQC